jgi:hypothetical protein
MDTVSQLQKIIIRLDKPQVPCEIICEKVQSLINKSAQSGINLSDSFLTIEIKTVSQVNDDSIPKLEHKEIDS